ncbi:MAG: hypothetical protein M3333_09025, partial [Actinomycetota bacterium]|nr:hypothetical protein [Actinomycetota bacterium]
MVVMTRPGRAGIAGGTVILYAICMIGALSLAFQNKNVGLATVPFMVTFTAFTCVGALIVARRPGNRMGWIFSAGGLAASTGLLAQEYAEYSYMTSPGPLPGRIFAVWYTSWYWYPVLGLMFVFTLLYFPNGRLLSDRWRMFATFAWAALIAITVMAMLAPKLEIQDEDKVVHNPIGVRALGMVEQSTAGSVLFAAFLCSIAGAFVSLVVRFRRSTGEERQQLKWFTYAGTLTMLLPLTFGISLPGVAGDLLLASVLAFLPIATGVAILKYRLYDIDVLINRTLVYGGLTAILALVYVAGVVVLGGALRSVTGQSGNNLAVAASTLGVAALFRPARSRIQSFIDRRFYRHKYDAGQTLESFSARLREEVELGMLTAHLLTAVSDTMRPSHVSL